MSDPYLGEIRCFGFNFAPVGWFMCNGQTLPITSYAALYSILGTSFGGNGTTTFQLPNLQGVVPMHWGTTPGLPTTNLGETQGAADVTLNISQMPMHTHQAVAGQEQTTSVKSATPSSTAFLSNVPAPDLLYALTPTVNTAFSPMAISTTGGSIPHENMQPYLTLNFCIAYQGQFPTRN